MIFLQSNTFLSVLSSLFQLLKLYAVDGDVITLMFDREETSCSLSAGTNSVRLAINALPSTRPVTAAASYSAL